MGQPIRDMLVLRANGVEPAPECNPKLLKPVIDGVKTRLLRDRPATKV
jgi:hypothetical protein